MIKEGEVLGEELILNLRAFFPIALTHKTKSEDRKLEARCDLENTSPLPLEFEVIWGSALSFFA